MIWSSIFSLLSFKASLRGPVLPEHIGICSNLYSGFLQVLNCGEQYTQEEVRDGMDLMLFDAERRLPKGFRRIRCNVCNGMLFI